MAHLPQTLSLRLSTFTLSVTMRKKYRSLGPETRSPTPLNDASAVWWSFFSVKSKLRVLIQINVGFWSHQFFSTFFSRKYWYKLSVNPLWIPLIVAGSGKVWLRAEEAAVYSTGTYCFLDLHPTTILLPYTFGKTFLIPSFQFVLSAMPAGTLLTKSWTNFGDIFQPGDKWKRFGFRRDLYEILCR